MEVKGTGLWCVLINYVKYNYYVIILAAVTAAEKCTLILDDVKYWSVKYRSRSWCMLEEYVKDNYYAMFHIPHMNNLRVYIIFLISAQKDRLWVQVPTI